MSSNECCISRCEAGMICLSSTNAAEFLSNVDYKPDLHLLSSFLALSLVNFFTLSSAINCISHVQVHPTSDDNSADSSLLDSPSKEAAQRKKYAVEIIFCPRILLIHAYREFDDSSQ